MNIDLINASAGSGKTYNLTSRVAAILNNGASPEEVMVTTFTIRAAAELRERIRLQLLKNKKPDEASRLSYSLIGTVNGICARLLKEYAIDAGMSPALEVIPEEDSRNIFKISIDRVIGKYAAYMEPAARRLELDGRGNGYQTTDDWRDHVRKIVDLARSNMMTPDQLTQCGQKSWSAYSVVFGKASDRDLDAELKTAVTSAIDDLNSLGELKKTTQKVLVSLQECEKRLSRNQLAWSDWVRMSKLKPAKDGLDIVEPVCTVADYVLQHPQFQADVKQIIEGAFNCASEALKDYETYKKEHGLMDFIDQETCVLQLASNNKAFRESIKDRINTLLVDEFQDTSPIQLALFLALNSLAGKAVWVGDPKQAIYGFRGTDPQLMNEIVGQIGTSQVLDCSWRSKENLLSFTNALFSEVFYDMGADKVCLKVPLERTEAARGGNLEAWHLTVSNKDDEAASIANGIRDLIERTPGVKPGDIAVLSRTNNSCNAVAAKLESIGVRASVGQGLLMDTRECRLALAALRYMNNQGDTLALTEIMNCAGAEWLQELMSNPEEAKQKWNEDPMIAALRAGRENIKFWTPLEALEQAISRIGLLRKLKAWPNPQMARSNLDIMRRTCREYIDKCASHRSAATVDGFVYYLRNTEVNQAEGLGEHTVNVLTYHGAKGLEWPWVVLTDLDSTPKGSVFGVSIEPAPAFDMMDPLADRSVRYWPWPFGAQNKYEQLDLALDEMPIKQLTQDMAEREAQRLLYVGMTRAKDGLVLAVRYSVTNSGASLKAGWLDALKNAQGNSVFRLSLDTDSKTAHVGSAVIPMAVYSYNHEDAGLPGLTSNKEEYLPVLPSMCARYPAARVSPSGLSVLPAGSDGMSWQIIERFGARIIIRGKPEMDALGNAVHAYLAADYVRLSDDERQELAFNVMRNWGVETAAEPSEIVLAGQHLTDFIAQKYAGCKVYTEWPIMLKNEADQILQGWIDMLVETADGYVIIDHKDYPGADAETRARMYIPQMMAYKEAVEKATGKTVVDILLHLPISGLVLRLG